MNSHPLVVNDIFLLPGCYSFGFNNYRIRTLLGSCVALILMHQEKKIGGMAHIMLPQKNNNQTNPETPAKFADDSFELFIASAKIYKTNISDYKAKLFGGSNMFAKYKSKEFQDVSEKEETVYKNLNEKIQIGKRNIEFIKSMLEKYKIPILGEDLDGNLHRKIYYTIWDSEVWVEKPQDEK